ncbi:MAG TPA: phenylalanine--tRNA ligase subunit alpha, partial [Verrucomicrobiales bacterium]|nr:phenylalanine--tRNA ligase subunit alpha [Verrucomicrobiales bacterium]
MLEHIDPTAQEALSALESASDLQTLDQARVRYLGVNGQFTALLKQMGSLPKEDRPKAGVQINQAKKKLEALLARRKEELEMAAAMPSQATDFSLPGRRPVLGKCHPLTQVTEDIVKSFRKIGFVVADGPEIEDEYHCFDALNTPADHPARDSQDTFYIQSPERPLLRTHTSSVQIRVMENQPPPIRVIVPGRVYRRDTADATHNPTFHQIEGLYVDRGVTLGDLKGTVEFVFQELLGKDVKLRFRPHYFSYTEPSLEIDFSSSLTRKMGKEWLEIAGCGMVHPKVFDAVGYDPDQWSGWAFGFGIERIAMIRYGI